MPSSPAITTDESRSAPQDLESTPSSQREQVATAPPPAATVEASAPKETLLVVRVVANEDHTPIAGVHVSVWKTDTKDVRHIEWIDAPRG
jgi:hypothetical protein